jgi:hypothetical protein
MKACIAASCACLGHRIEILVKIHTDGLESHVIRGEVSVAIPKASDY